MERRKLLFAGAGIAATGAVSLPMITAKTASAAATSGSTMAGPSIFDFGAVGDGVTDDSAAFSQALAFAAANGRMVRVPSFTYAIAKPIKFTSVGHAGNTWGLTCEGARLQSKITTGENVIDLVSKHTVRYLRITGGLKINGTGTDGYGLRIFCAGSSAFFYNVTIDGLSVEKMGKSGLLFEGNVFESVISNSHFQDNKENGATFAHSQGGVCSAINIIGCYFNQNGKYGLCATNFDGVYGGTTDIRVYGGYCRDNQSYGFYYNNGTAGVTIEQVGFENNCKSLAPGDAKGAHVYGMVSMRLLNCVGYNQYGGATYLLRGWFSGLTTLEGCSQDSGAQMAATGKSRLVQIDGDAKGHVYMRNCTGGIALKNATTACTWKAENCTGDSPLGALNVRGIVGV